MEKRRQRELLRCWHFSPQTPRWRPRLSLLCSAPSPAWWHCRLVQGELGREHRGIHGKHLREVRCLTVKMACEKIHICCEWSTSNTHLPGRGRVSSCFQGLCRSVHMVAFPGSWWCYWPPLYEHKPSIRDVTSSVNNSKTLCTSRL